MLEILICDDEQSILDYIRTEIEKQILIHEYDMKVKGSYTSPEDLLHDLAGRKGRQNIYFLDVELKDSDYDGFLLGREIRRLDPNGTIVYVTSFRDLAYKTFQYHIEAFDYIVKDSPEQLSSSIGGCLKSIVQRLKEEVKEASVCYTCRSGEKLYHIPIEDIYYFETSSRSHCVILHGRNQRIEFSGNLSDIEKEIGEGFLKIHRSYLIALDKIESIDLKHNEVKVGGSICAISRRMKSHLLEKIGQ
ncbi:MAG: LytTR family DNA-binding domain-containing protein [Faecalicatena sp.]|uniref:LytR/AlgR family response regulator transcription factor n=1 Tax=Faecalicatena sp. TaxID=2005360 RepID=UPI0025880FC3|nr:LytTR family DNA-binding domain-containing protein [Faecalicatena sp.]MCI6464302.1 LytTR family DNA-binding domain-containing protein [Faecalicatena sp.]MDY5621276.1 LytTR family DNA-binding domain-containing protein [Lachnospiraceae bacterium]